METAEKLIEIFQNFEGKDEVAILTENPDGSLKLVAVSDKKNANTVANKIKGYDCCGHFIEEHRMLILYN